MIQADIDRIGELEMGIKDYQERTKDLHIQLEVLLMVCDHKNAAGNLILMPTVSKDHFRCPICSQLWSKNELF